MQCFVDSYFLHNYESTILQYSLNEKNKILFT